MKKTKKNTKVEQGKAALHQRLSDLSRGAFGEYDFDEEMGMIGGHSAESLSLWIGAVKKVFLTGDANKMLAEPRYLDNYDSLDNLVDLLWEHGVRP